MLISFKLKKADTLLGQKVHLVGSIPQLGLWKVSYLMKLILFRLKTLLS